jgi:hypothetical protein
MIFGKDTVGLLKDNVESHLDHVAALLLHQGCLTKAERPVNHVLRHENLRYEIRSDTVKKWPFTQERICKRRREAEERSWWQRTSPTSQQRREAYSLSRHLVAYLQVSRADAYQPPASNALATVATGIATASGGLAQLFSN